MSAAAMAGVMAARARIKPSVGRVLWFRPPRDLLNMSRFITHRVEADGRPLYTAQVAFVHDDGRINVGFMDHAGNPGQYGPVPIWQEGDGPVALDVAYCEWMPYQKGQAAKADADGADLVQLRRALDESLKLQSHYAMLLNAHDGGHRLGFTVDEWLARIGRP